ncbi:MAG: hypothetical protein AMXMBFR58_27840 [Phycisphaerae bacterium]|nr:DNA-binding transcriptional activator EvgA [Phycisphaerales bacterium]MCK6477882.1 response regulator transcription factor [Phycisphaerales bacterium]
MSTTDRPVRLLCLDDNADVLAALAIGARRAGIDCVGGLTECDGLCEHVRTLRPDVVLLDLTMPGTNPMTAIAELSAQFPAVSIVAFSGYDDDQTREQALNSGAAAFVSKHEDLDRVMAVIQRLGVKGTPA